MNYRSQGGYIALISVLLISSVLLVSVLEASYGSFFTIFNILRTTDKEQSFLSAKSCIEVVLIRLTENPNYQPKIGGDIFSFDQNTCSIKYPITKEENVMILHTSATINRVVTNLTSQVILLNNHASILSIIESS